MRCLSCHAQYDIKSSSSLDSNLSFNYYLILCIQDCPEGFDVLLEWNLSSIKGYLILSDLGLNVPSRPIIIFSNDTHGASTIHQISIILCGCINNGTCIEVANIETATFDDNGHFKKFCNCPEFYGGDSCEIEMKGCNYSACPYFSTCVDNEHMPSGYECSECSTGYTFNNSKCTGNSVLPILTCVICRSYISVW